VPADPIPRIGREIGRYRLLRRVGEGARGVVFEADDPAFDRSVAVKILRPELRRDEGVVRSFRDEAEATARVQHPNVVSILDTGETPDGHLYTVMEFVDGPSLETRLEPGAPLGWREAVDIAVQIGRALREAHALGFLHRDVKPGNVLVSKDGHAFLTDFGIVKDISSLRGFLVHGRSVGTAAYASPEQCLGKRLMPATDVYSLGATLYHMLTGRLPFPGKTNQEFMNGHVKGRLVPPHEVEPSLPRPLSNCVVKMMARSPLERYESLDPVLADLEMIGEGKKPMLAGPVARGGEVRLESRRTGRTPAERVAARTGAPSLRVWILVGVLVALAVAALILLVS
jgi:serine/threonine protein kinase